MGEGMQAAICVSYRNIDGYHVFTSDDVYGLYIASKDAMKAFMSIPASIEKLIKINEGLDVKVDPLRSFGDFLRAIRGEERDSAPAVLSSSCFAARIRA